MPSAAQSSCALTVRTYCALRKSKCTCRHSCDCSCVALSAFIFILLYFSKQKSRQKLSSLALNTTMKSIKLAELKPDPKIDGDNLTKGSAKWLFEQTAKALEAREARSRYTLQATRHRGKPSTDEEAVVRENVGDRTSTLGSDEFIYTINADCGLFASVITAYNRHWKLRTSPDDWWFVVARRVAIAIDQNSRREAVRKMFVEHEGIKVLWFIAQ